jgi:hypothetical protein
MIPNRLDHVKLVWRNRGKRRPLLFAEMPLEVMTMHKILGCRDYAGLVPNSLDIRHVRTLMFC